MEDGPHFVKNHSVDDFVPILAELRRKALPVNYDRMVAGSGKSQAFGVIRRWSYRPWLSRNTWMRPELWSLLQEFARRHVTVPWSAVQVNDNYKSAPHRDKGNQGLSYIVGFGNYTGGELVIGEERLDIHHKAYLFNGSRLLHETAPWVGCRYSLVFFDIEWPAKFPRYTVTSRYVEDGTEVTDSYDDSIVVLDRKGHIVRVIRQGCPREWIGRLTQRGQRSRQAEALPSSMLDAGET